MYYITNFLPIYCIVTFLMLLSCGGAEVSAPKVTLNSLTPSDEIPRGRVFTIKVDFSDAEGDVDSIYMIKVVKGSPLDSIKNLAYPVITPRNVRNGSLSILLFNGQLNANDLSIASMVDLKTPRDYEVSYTIWAIDKAKYKSNVIQTPYILTRYTN